MKFTRKWKILFISDKIGVESRRWYQMHMRASKPQINQGLRLTKYNYCSFSNFETRKNTYFAGSHALDNGVFEPFWVFPVRIYLFSALFVRLYFVWRGLLKFKLPLQGTRMSWQTPLFSVVMVTPKLYTKCWKLMDVLKILVDNHNTIPVTSFEDLSPSVCIIYIVELQQLKHLWDHGHLFSTWVVRTTQGWLIIRS